VAAEQADNLLAYCQPGSHMAVSGDAQPELGSLGLHANTVVLPITDRTDFNLLYRPTWDISREQYWYS
jgi:hypothetical protein